MIHHQLLSCLAIWWFGRLVVWSFGFSVLEVTRTRIRPLYIFNPVALPRSLWGNRLVNELISYMNKQNPNKTDEVDANCVFFVKDGV